MQALSLPPVKALGQQRKKGEQAIAGAQSREVRYSDE
jgi:hypothetical protein